MSTPAGWKGQPEAPPEKTDESTYILPTLGDIRFKGPAKTMAFYCWFLFIANVLGFFLLVVRFGNVLFTEFTHTYDLPTGSPGTLISTRFGFYYWVIVVPFVIYVAMLILGGIRATMPWHGPYSIIHTGVAILSTILEFAAAIGILAIGNNANSLSDPLNPGRSEFFCMLNSYPNNQLLTPKGCPTPTVPYTSTASTPLGWNDIFKNNFGFTWASFVIAAIQAVVGILMTRLFVVAFESGNTDVYLEGTYVPLDDQQKKMDHVVTSNTPIEQENEALLVESKIGAKIVAPAPISQQMSVSQVNQGGKKTNYNLSVYSKNDKAF